MVWLSETAAELPLSHQYVEAPFRLLLFVYVSGLGLWELPLSFLAKRNGSLILAVLAFAGFAYERETHQGEFKLTVLPLDSGSALFAKKHD